MRDRRYLVVIPAAALLAVLPLIVRGNSCGHDFEFHVFNWLEVVSQWKQGSLWPHWEFTAAANSGEPRFVFYPPLSWILGAMLGLILPWAAVPVAMIWFALTACGLTMHRFAREWTGEGSSLIVAALYMVHPYTLFTFYERSAYAELLASAWLPLILLSVLKRRLTLLSVAVPVTLIWLTNDPAAVIGCYSLALLGTLCIAGKLVVSRRVGDAMREAATLALGTCLGFGLAGFYLIPAIVEQKWVQISMVSVPGVRVQDNFLFQQIGSQAHRAILRTASLTSVSLLIAIAVFALIGWWFAGGRVPGREPVQTRRATVALILMASAVAFALTSSSAVLWRQLPELNNLQFPWRFNAVLGAVAAALLSMAMTRLTLRYALGAFFALALALIVSINGQSHFRQLCNRGNDVGSLVSEFESGRVYDLTDEYTPLGADTSAIRHSNPNAWLAAAPSDAAPGTAPQSYSVKLSDRLHFDVSSAESAFLVINLRDYPAWRIAMNGINVTSHPHRPDGLIVMPISKGETKIDITYALTWDRVAGWLLTAFSACMVSLIWRSRERNSAPSQISN